MSISSKLTRGGLMKPIKMSSKNPFGRVDFNMFFDRVQVASALDKKEMRVLSRTGSFSRGVLRRSIRSAGKKGRKSSVGEPPRYHIRGFPSLKDGIFFQADLGTGSVIIGPTYIRTQTQPHGNIASGAQLLEEGGRATITIKRFNRPSTSGNVRPPRVQQINARYRERPFVGPARAPTQAKMLELIQTIPI